MDTATMQGASARTRAMVECALCVALSVVFSYIKFFRMPQGGSITLEMAPLLYLAYRRGAGWGIAAGAMSGALQMLLGGYVVHPVQALLDYPLAFACLGLAGLSRAHPLLASFVAVAARLFCHVLSGVVFFSQYVPEWQNPWVYSGVYNASFMVPSMIISGALAWALWRRMGRSAPPGGEKK
ncbi:energy-coupled thiamine transporter ThiT [Synergistaceae bacterium OttesenSCG-928-I11]|nr:energy-coupled thiamine transporter ThiT [Synergistaceae bacterium OttesenSCG-928-I11]